MNIWAKFGLSAALAATFSSANAATVSTTDGAITIMGGVEMTAPAIVAGKNHGNDIFGAIKGYRSASLKFSEMFTYIVTYLGYEAGDTNWVKFENNSYFLNKGHAPYIESAVGDKMMFTAGEVATFIFDGHHYKTVEATNHNASSNLFMAIDPTNANNVLLGFNDRNGGVDSDYDDITISISAVAATTPVPVPAAGILFGSALLGLFGINIRKKKSKA